MQIPQLPEQFSVILALMIFLVIGFIAVSRAERGVSVRLVVSMLVLATLTLAVGVAMRWDRLGQGPFMSLFEVLHSNLFSLSLIYMLIYWRYEKIRATLPMTMGFFALLSIWAMSSNTDQLVLPPTFNHPWLWIHVITGKIFLAFCMTASFLALSLLGQKILARPAVRLRPESHDPVIWRLLVVAFIFHSLMLIAGSVWAHDAWGRYWSWDPLETWSLLTWLSLAVVLHVRVTFQITPWLGWMLVTGVFILAFLTFFGMPFVSQAPHKGVM